MSEFRTTLDRLLACLSEIGAPVATLLAPGLTDAELEERLAGLEPAPPADLLDLYRWRNGMKADRPVDAHLFPGFCFLSLDEALDQYAQLRAMAQQVAAQARIDPSTVWDARWFPVFADYAGGYRVVVCDGDPRSSVVHDVFLEDPPGRLAFDGMPAMVAAGIKACEAGEWMLATDGLIVVRPAASNASALLSALYDRGGDELEAVVLALRETESTEGVDALVTALGDGDALVRSRAVWALGAIGGAAAVDPLIERLGDENGAVRSNAAQALGALQDRRAVPALIAALDDRFGDVRALAAWALGELGEPTAEEPLQRLAHDPDPTARRLAEQALATLRRRGRRK